MRKDLLLSEVLTKVHNAPTELEKGKILRVYETKGLLNILKYAFGPNIEFDCRVTEYNPSNRPAGMDYANLQAEARRLYIFTKDYQKVSPQRKREILLNILESINVTEAKLLQQILDKDIKVNGLTPVLIDKVFPGLLHYKNENGTWVKYPDGSESKENTIDNDELFNFNDKEAVITTKPLNVKKGKSGISKNTKVIE